MWVACKKKLPVHCLFAVCISWLVSKHPGYQFSLILIKCWHKTGWYVCIQFIDDGEERFTDDEEEDDEAAVPIPKKIPKVFAKQVCKLLVLGSS